MSVERLILSNLIYNDEYVRKVIPYLKNEYFQDTTEKVLFEITKQYIEKYNNSPTIEALYIELSNKPLNEELFNSCKETLGGIQVPEKKSDLNWLLSQTEKFCKDKAIYNAIRKSIELIDEDNKSKMDKGEIPTLLSDALAISFDTHVGHDYIEDAQDRFEYYRRKLDRIPFDLEYLNRITNGGVPRKTISVFLAGTNVGKTQLMCHMAAHNLRCSKNVLYITLEMAQEEISKRIDANLMDISMDDLMEVPINVLTKKMEHIKKTTTGKIIVKEYPTSQAGASHFRHLLNELKLKKNFVPDIIYIDYINICCSSRIKRGNANSYDYIKAIAEELRGLAVEKNVPIITATQTNRSGFVSSDVGLEDTAESFGLPATADFMAALISTEELEEMGQILVKQLKNRLGNKATNKRFIIGLDRAKMRFYDVEDSAQEGLTDGPAPERPVMDNTSFGEEDRNRALSPPKFNREMFAGFK